MVFSPAAGLAGWGFVSGKSASVVGMAAVLAAGAAVRFVVLRLRR